MNIFPILSEFCRKNPFFAIGIGFFFVLLSLLMLAGPFSLFIAYLNDTDIQVLNQVAEGTMTDPSIIRFVLIVEGWTQVLTWGLVGLVMMYLVEDKMENISPKQLPILPIAILMMLAAIPLAQFVAFDAESFRLPSFLSELEKSIEDKEASTNGLIKALLSDKSAGTLVLNILVLALVPGVCEEIFFRNFIQKRLSAKYSPFVAILLSSIIFSAAHFQFFGFFSRMILGAVLGYVFYVSNSIVPSLLAHLSYNATMLFGVYAADARGMDLEKEVHIPIWGVLISISGLYFLGKMAFRTSQKE